MRRSRVRWARSRSPAMRWRLGILGQPEATLAAFAEALRENNEKLRCFRLPVQATRLADGSLLTGRCGRGCGGRGEVERGTRRKCGRD